VNAAEPVIVLKVVGVSVALGVASAAHCEVMATLTGVVDTVPDITRVRLAWPYAANELPDATSLVNEVMVTAVAVAWKPAVELSVVPLAVTVAVTVSAPALVLLVGNIVVVATPELLVSAELALKVPRPDVVVNFTTWPEIGVPDALVNVAVSVAGEAAVMVWDDRLSVNDAAGTAVAAVVKPACPVTVVALVPVPMLAVAMARSAPLDVADAGAKVTVAVPVESVSAVPALKTPRPT